MIRLKKHLRLLLIILLLPTLFFLFYLRTHEPSTKHNYPETRVEKILKRGYLIAITADVPECYFVANGREMGYDHDLLNELAREMGVGLKFLFVKDAEEGFRLLAQGRGDLLGMNLMNGPLRNKFFLSTIPVRKSDLVLITSHTVDTSTYYSLEDNVRTVYYHPSLVPDSMVKDFAWKKKWFLIPSAKGITYEDLFINLSDDPSRAFLCDEHIAREWFAFYKKVYLANITSIPLDVTWFVRRGEAAWLKMINEWIINFKESGTYENCYRRYFISPGFLYYAREKGQVIRKGKLSPYDEEIRESSKVIGWDWRLLAALIHRESRFNPYVRSYNNAYGLMQLMPATALAFGFDTTDSPSRQIEAGVTYLKYLDGMLKKAVPDADQRIRFILAAYNVGLSHVIDARHLAEKHGKDPSLWEGHVDYFLRNKSREVYLQDSVVQFGPCPCEGAYHFVNEVLDTYDHFREIIGP